MPFFPKISNVLDYYQIGGGGGGSVTASNGLTKTGSDIKLGGTLIQNTYLNGFFSFLLGNTTPLDSIGFTTSSGGGTSNFYQDNYEITLSHSEPAGVAGFISATTNESKIIWQSTAAGQKSVYLDSNGVGIDTEWSGSRFAYLKSSLISTNRTFEFPNASGTIALTSNLTGYLALSGGTMTGGIVLAASSVSVKPITFTSGPLPVTPVAATFEYDGNKFYSTNSTAVRGVLLDIRTFTSSAGTLTLALTYSHYVFTGTTTTWTLPAITGNTNVVYLIKNRGTGNITLNTNAGGNDIYSTSAISTTTISPGSAITLVNDGTYWNVE